MLLLDEDDDGDGDDDVDVDVDSGFVKEEFNVESSPEVKPLSFAATLLAVGALATTAAAFEATLCCCCVPVV